MRGRLIVIEGLDGVGKTTLSRGLADALGAAWRTTPSEALRAHRAPFDAAYAALPAASQLFYSATVVAAAAEANTLRDAGQDVVFDRYWCTTRAYARAAGSPLDLEEVEALLPPADVTILVDLPDSERRARLEARGATALDQASLIRGAVLRNELLAALTRPIAGRGCVLDVAGLEPTEAVRAAHGCITETSTLFHRWAG